MLLDGRAPSSGNRGWHFAGDGKDGSIRVHWDDQPYHYDDTGESRSRTVVCSVMYNMKTKVVQHVPKDQHGHLTYDK